MGKPRTEIIPTVIGPIRPEAGEHDIAPSDERMLIEQAQAGDRVAFEQLVRRYDRRVLGLLLKRLQDREQARDAYQETFLRAYRSIGYFRFQSSFYTWVGRIAINASIDILRKRQHLSAEIPIESRHGDAPPHSLSWLDTFESDRPDPERCLYSSEIGERIREALGKLSSRERLVFELRYLDGLRLKVIGRIVGTSEQTARNHAYRAKHKIRAELRRTLPEQGRSYGLSRRTL